MEGIREIDGSEAVSFGSFSAIAGNEATSLLKALTAGSSANPATMTGGNALQFESLEGNLADALEQNQKDFKLMRMMYKNQVGSTVHQYSVNKDSGDDIGVFAAELAAPIETNGSIERRTRTMKYMQTKREVSLQAMMLNPSIEQAERLEQKQGTHVLLKAAERACFHGDEAVSTDMFDGFPAQIRKSTNTPNILDLRGEAISSTNGEAKFEEAIRTISERGGEASHAYFPFVVAKDFQDLVRDRIRFGTDDKSYRPVIEDWPSVYDTTVKIGGPAGQNKMYRVKGVPVPAGSGGPTAPTFALGVQATTGTGTGFVAATAGTYRYTVYAVSSSGLISAAATPANQAVTAGNEVVVTITPAVSNAGTGFIICRGKKDTTTGTDLREMIRVANSLAATTVFLDQDDELPGTAEVLLLTAGSDEISRTFQWDSFVDLMRFNLGATKPAIPFIMVWYGAADMKIPERNALIKNVGHSGIDWF
jgi:hypothetical protein